MEHTLRQAKECGGLHTLSKNKLHALMRASIEEYIDRVLPDLCEKSARFRYLFNRLCATVERIMDEVSEELQSSDFEPLAFELEFGADGQLPAITIREENGTARVVGKVDRVDGWLHDGKLYLLRRGLQDGQEELRPRRATLRAGAPNAALPLYA